MRTPPERCWGLAIMSAPPIHDAREDDTPSDTPLPDTSRSAAERADSVRADIVTASDLVRQFGLWQERATRAPVYVMFRGRPRLVLTSIEVMEALVAPHVPEHDLSGPDAAALLDLIRDMVVIADAELRVSAASRTARAYFGESVAPGISAEMLVPVASRAALLRAQRHVQSTGVAQTLDLPSPRRPERLLTVTIEPHRRGVAMLVQDVTPAE